MRRRPGVPGITIIPENLSEYRLINAAPLEEKNFELVISGTAYWEGQYVDTHVKHYLGLVQRDVLPPDEERYKIYAGFDNEDLAFENDTHYRININDEIGCVPDGSLDFTVYLTKIDNRVITSYSTAAEEKTIINEYELVDPNAPLSLEFVEVDVTSYGSGYTAYHSLEWAFVDLSTPPLDFASLADINGNGFPEIAILRLNKKGHPVVIIKDSDNGDRIKSIFFFSPAHDTQDLRTVPDINGDGLEELAVMAHNRDLDQPEMEIRDPLSGEVIRNIRIQD